MIGLTLPLVQFAAHMRNFVMKMQPDFAYHPTNGLPRIIRFVETFKSMPEHRGVSEAVMPTVVCMLDSERNVLTINRELFDRLDVRVQRDVQKTLDPITVLA